MASSLLRQLLFFFVLHLTTYHLVLGAPSKQQADKTIDHVPEQNTTTVDNQDPDEFFVNLLADGELEEHEDFQNLTKRIPPFPPWSGFHTPPRYPLSRILADGRSLIPDINFWSQNIRSHTISQSTCLFYSSFTGVPPPTTQREILDWYNCNILPLAADPLTGEPPRPGIVANMIINTPVIAFRQTLMSSIDNCNVRSIFHDNNSGLDISASASSDGIFSQAFAEACTGVAYWFAPKGISNTNPPPLSVWTKYELPALRTSGQMTAIGRVTMSDGGVEYADDDHTILLHPQLIWSPGDPNALINAPARPNPDGFRFYAAGRGNPNPPNGAGRRCFNDT